MPSKSPKKGTEEFGKKSSIANDEVMSPCTEAPRGSRAQTSTDPNPAPHQLCGWGLGGAGVIQNISPLVLLLSALVQAEAQRRRRGRPSKSEAGVSIPSRPGKRPRLPVKPTFPAFLLAGQRRCQRGTPLLGTRRLA